MKKSILLIIATFATLVASAHDFEVDGIYYNITSEADKTAEVTYKGDDPYQGGWYSGSITIPATVTHNGVEYSVTSIGERAFCYCSLTSINIPEGVTSIGERAFYGCSNLTAITLPARLTSIGEGAFSYCRSLTAITIPEGVTSIGGNAFYNCSSLTAIAIPEGVTSIGERAFYGCSNLTAIVVAEGNAVYDSRGGCNAIIETNSNTLIAGCSTTIIPESVTSIGGSAFAGCSSLTTITIPESVTSIGESAFVWCSSLTSITIPEESQLTSIEYGAFAGCSSLTSITIPEGVTSIGEWAFEGCSSLTDITISESVTSIKAHAFRDCSSLTTITLPEGVTSIGDEAFSGCNSLTSITIPSRVTSIESSAFISCSSLTSITIPEGSQLTSIGDGAFADCSSLTSITLPESVTSIGYGAFSGCSSLTSITCEAATPPTIDGSYTFKGVDKSIPLYVPEGSVEDYQSAAYWNEFANIKGVVASGTCGDNLTWKLTEEYELIIEGTGEMYDYSYNNQPWHEYRESIQAITIPEGVTSIGNYAFYSCTRLTNINIPEGVTSIGEDVFFGCSSLTAITIPEGVTSIGWNAFSNCTILTAITVAEGNAVYDSRGGCNAIIETNSNTLIAGCSATIIPEGVTSIGRYAFYACSGLTAINIPASVMSIGNYAFYECSGLTAINIPEGVTSIGDSAFQGCSSLTAINIPEGVTSIGDSAFQGCSSLTAITLPEGVTSIGHWAFQFCSSLISLTIPMSTTSIGEAAFSCCSSLTSIIVTEGNTIYDSREGCNAIIETSSNTLVFGCSTTIIPESVTSIGGAAFSRCSNLASIIIPKDVTSIGNYAFDYCSSLTTITIPEGVTSIGSSAFNSCSSLTSITCNGLTPPTIGNSDTFANVDKSIPVYVPAGSVEAYQSAAYWNEFTNIVDVDKEYSVNFIVDEETIQTLSTTANTSVDIPSMDREGYTFSGWTASFALNLKKNAYAMLYSNAPCTETKYGDQFVGWHVLFDDNANTFFHSEYKSDTESADGLDHYLRVDMGEGNSIKQFTFTYTVRGNDSSYTPTEIVVEGSNEAFGDYEEIAVLRNLPTERADQYTSEVLGNGVAYRYIRYRVTETSNNLKVCGHPYFYFAEFDMKGSISIDVSEGYFVMPAADVVLVGSYIPKAITLVDADAPYSRAEDEVFNSITYTRNFKNTNWQALYVPFDIPVTEEFLEEFDVAYIYDTRQYDYNEDGVVDDVVIESFKKKSGVLNANYPYLIRAKVKGEKSIIVTDATLYAAEENSYDCSSMFDTYTFTGTYNRIPGTELPQNEGYYALSGGVWQPIASSSSLGAFRFYLKIDSRNQHDPVAHARSIRMRIFDENGEEDTTGIAETVDNGKQTTVIYDLQGRRITDTDNLKGVYIVNGKKVIL